jgi:tetratricopeptide (TPR) repeat protein
VPDLFISHSSADDAFVRRLRQGLEEHGVDAWIDSRELLPGGLLEPDITGAIEAASAFAVVVSPNSLQSKWVGKELHFALEVQQRRGKDKYAVIPLSLDGTRLGVLESFFDGEPLYVPMSSAAGGVDAAMNSLLVALGKRLPTDHVESVAHVQQPVEELRLELTDFRMQSADGETRASARARLVYEPGTAGETPVATLTSWRLDAPLGEAELDELRWYLETFARWPYEHFRSRAQAVEANLVRWGRQLYDAALPAAQAAQVTGAWSRNVLADRRFSVLADAEGALEAGTSTAQVQAARAAAALFLKLPWGLLHDGEKHLLEGAGAVGIRHRLPNTRPRAAAAVSLPIRVLVVSPRPDDDACEYLDHRASTLPLIDALEGLGEIVQLRTLTPPTLPALRKELDRARSTGETYHVIHFDGFGSCDAATGLSGLCFEDSQDVVRLSRRRRERVNTRELGTLLRERNVAVVVLDARPASHEQIALESIATELLQAGVSSIVTTRQTALPDAARRFLTAFYRALAAGRRIGGAVIEGQRELKDDAFRGRVWGAGDARIQDWFNPVLYQDRDDLQLFRSTPSQQTEADIRAALATRLGGLPQPPQSGFVGRSRGLLALERLLEHERYAVLRGPVGAGKSSLAVEFGRWMVRSRRFDRATLVALGPETTPTTLLAALAEHLVGQSAIFDATNDAERTLKQIERALLERSTLLLLDDVERRLPPPETSAGNASPQAGADFGAIAAICQRLVGVGHTRLIFVSRERLPAPFDGNINRREVMPLPIEEAVELVGRQLAPTAIAASREEIEELSGLLHGHAGTLATLGVPLLRFGVARARSLIGNVFIELARSNPGDNHLSPFGAIEHALSRVSPANRDRAHVLAPFHGGLQSGVLRDMTGWETDDVILLISELEERGLGVLLNESYLALVPALSPYLRSKMAAETWSELEGRWQRATREYGAFLMTTGREDAVVTSERLALDIPNFLALLEYDERHDDAAMTVGTATSLITVLTSLGKSALVDRVTKILQTTVQKLQGDWSQAHFAALDTRIEQMREEGQTAKACETASGLLQLARTAGPNAYDGADFDLATACRTLGAVLSEARRAEEALPLIDEARSRFENLGTRFAGAAERMAVTCILDKADCLTVLGQFEEAAALCEEGVRKLTQLKEERGAAVAAAQLGTVRRRQGRFAEALVAFDAARQVFSRLNEPASVAQGYGESGRAYAALGRFGEAEEAYRNALEIWVRLGNAPGEARELSALALLYADHLNRPQDAMVFFQRAAETFAMFGDGAGEAAMRNNLADGFRAAGRLDEARSEIERAILLKKSFGYSLQPWSSWAILELIETDAGNTSAAAKAQRAALDSYLSYRRGGGQIEGGPSKLTTEIERQIKTDGVDSALEFLRDLGADANSSADLCLYCRVLETILKGNRDPASIAAAGLNFAAAAEALLLIDHLERANSVPAPESTGSPVQG